MTGASITTPDETGRDRTFTVGDRITWKNPGGVGGAEVSGTIEDISGTFVRVAADPSATLQSAHALAGFIPFGYALPLGSGPFRCGMDGKGGTIMFLVDRFELDTRRGLVRRVGKTVRKMREA